LVGPGQGRDRWGLGFGPGSKHARMRGERDGGRGKRREMETKGGSSYRGETAEVGRIVACARGGVSGAPASHHTWQGRLRSHRGHFPRWTIAQSGP
jgi:hypothetical protein